MHGSHPSLQPCEKIAGTPTPPSFSLEQQLCVAEGTSLELPSAGHLVSEFCPCMESFTAPAEVLSTFPGTRWPDMASPGTRSSAWAQCIPEGLWSREGWTRNQNGLRDCPLARAGGGDANRGLAPPAAPPPTRNLSAILRAFPQEPNPLNTIIADQAYHESAPRRDPKGVKHIETRNQARVASYLRSCQTHIGLRGPGLTAQEGGGRNLQPCLNKPC